MIKYHFTLKQIWDWLNSFHHSRFLLIDKQFHDSQSTFPPNSQKMENKTIRIAKEGNDYMSWRGNRNEGGKCVQDMIQIIVLEIHAQRFYNIYIQYMFHHIKTNATNTPLPDSNPHNNSASWKCFSCINFLITKIPCFSSDLFRETFN